MTDYQDLMDRAEEQLFANIKQAQELNLAAVGVLRSLARLAAPAIPAAGAAGQVRSQATHAVNRSVEFTTKLMKLQADYAARLLAEVGAAAEET